ncbi:MAG: sialidase family protein [Kofleriaceae bacterium]
MRPIVAIIALGLAAGVVHANGRPPLTNGVVFRPGDSETLYVRSTFGLLISSDAGCTFRWVCEQCIGYGGTFDPKYAVASDGTIFATTFTGLRVSRDGGCSFTTATAELAVGDPGRIADVSVEALDIGPTGEVWVATADSGKPNNVYRSTDNGVTFAPRGMLSPTIWWRSVAVAPSNPLRVYVTGYEVTSSAAPITHVYRTDDGGETWTELAVGSLAPILLVAAVDPLDPGTVFLRSGATSAGDRLYRSSDAGATFTEVLVTTEPIHDVLIASAATVLVATEAGTLFRSDTAGAAFAPVAGAPRVGCLGKRPDGTLLTCAANWEPDFMAVGTSSDATHWDPLFRFSQLAGPLVCPAGTQGHETCEQLWPGLDEQFGVVGPACGATPDGAEPSSGGCCEAGGPAPIGLAMMTFALMIVRRRRPAPRR